MALDEYSLDFGTWKVVCLQPGLQRLSPKPTSSSQKKLKIDVACERRRPQKVTVRQPG